MNFRNHRPSTQRIESFDIQDININSTVAGQLYHHHFTPEIGVAKISFWFPCGTNDQERPFIASAVFDLLLAGSSSLSEKEIIERIDYWGASVSCEAGTLGSTVTLRCKKEIVLELIQWVVEHASNAVYPEDQIENYQFIKAGGLERRMQTPGYWSERQAKESYYKGSKLGVFGGLSDIESLNRDEIIAFHMKHIHFGNAMIFLSGDINEKTCREILSFTDTLFVKPFEITAPRCESFSSTGETLKHSIKNSSQVSMYLMKHIGVIDEQTQHKLTLLNLMLGGYFGSRLMQELRENQGLTYGIGSSFRPAFDGRTWSISGEMNSANAEKALDETVKIMEEFSRTTVTEEELIKAQSYYSGSFRGGFDGPFSSMLKCQHLVLRNLDTEHYRKTLNYIWKTDTHQILDTAKAFLNPKEFQISLAGDI